MRPLSHLSLPGQCQMGRTRLTGAGEEDQGQNCFCFVCVKQVKETSFQQKKCQNVRFLIRCSHASTAFLHVWNH